MKLIDTIPYNKVDFKWISSHHDIYLEGTCIYKNELCKFETNLFDLNDDKNVKIFKLSLIEKTRWRYKQWLFEKCIGYHYSYPERKNGAYFYYRKPKWLYKWLFNVYYNLS